MVQRIVATVSLVLSLVLFALVVVSFFDPPSVVREVWPGKWVVVDVLRGQLCVRTISMRERTDAELREEVLNCDHLFDQWSARTDLITAPSADEVYEVLGGNPLDPERLPAFMKLIRTHEAAMSAGPTQFIRAKVDIHAATEVDVGLGRRWWSFERNRKFGTTYFYGLSRLIHMYDDVVILPLWTAASALLAWPAFAVFVAWRKRRMRRAGLCRACGYDLTGNVSGTCPECGAAVEANAGTAG